MLMSCAAGNGCLQCCYAHRHQGNLTKSALSHRRIDLTLGWNERKRCSCSVESAGFARRTRPERNPKQLWTSPKLEQVINRCLQPTKEPVGQASKIKWECMFPIAARLSMGHSQDYNCGTWPEIKDLVYKNWHMWIVLEGIVSMHQIKAGAAALAIWLKHLAWLCTALKLNESSIHDNTTNECIESLGSHFEKPCITFTF